LGAPYHGNAGISPKGMIHSHTNWCDTVSCLLIVVQLGVETHDFIAI